MMNTPLEERPTSQMPGPLPPTQQDAADLQRLIRYVERWRMAHFQRLENRQRLADADALLHKMRAGLRLAVEGGAAMANLGGRPQSLLVY